MKKTEYLDLLRYYLDRFPRSMVDEIIGDYEEHFSIGLENGKTEDEISSELGAPFYVAQEYISGDFGRIHREEKSRAVREPEGFFTEEVHPHAHAAYETEDAAYDSYDTYDEEEQSPLHRLSDRIRAEWNGGGAGEWILLSLVIVFALGVTPSVLEFVLTLATLVVILPISIVAVPFFGGLGAIAGGVGLLLSTEGVWLQSGFVTGLHPLTSILFGVGLIGLGMLLIIASVYAARFLKKQIMKLIYRIRWEWSKRRES